MEVETVDNDDNSSSDSEDDSSDNESENSGVSDRRPSKEGVIETDRQESKKQQGYFNMRGTRGMRGNLPTPCASHRSGLYQPRHANYTHVTVNHVNNNSKTQIISDSHINRNSKRRSTPKPKYEYLYDTNAAINSKNQTTSSKKKTSKHKSRDQGNSYSDHNSSHGKKVKPFLDAIALSCIFPGNRVPHFGREVPQFSKNTGIPSIFHFFVPCSLVPRVPYFGGYIPLFLDIPRELQ